MWLQLNNIGFRKNINSTEDLLGSQSVVMISIKKQEGLNLIIADLSGTINYDVIIPEQENRSECYRNSVYVISHKEINARTTGKTVIGWHPASIFSNLNLPVIKYVTLKTIRPFRNVNLDIHKCVMLFLQAIICFHFQKAKWHRKESSANSEETWF
ncbi:hypothetical protein PNOK_0182600 [Pyrrhoderma noxium]|uniref:Uncharacterized protein n=1 Tax=Pyrrhoderma noxium TaxID=2282107 RepID=A0A286UQQ7_9AGAM|nr:hypothetical protein PNOK_0182600 [Pyrrhoderma noxium]